MVLPLIHPVGADEASLVAGVGICTLRWYMDPMFPPLSPPSITTLPFGLRLQRLLLLRRDEKLQVIFLTR